MKTCTSLRSIPSSRPSRRTQFRGGFALATALSLAVLAPACGKGGDEADDTDSGLSEIATGAISGAVNASASGGTLAWRDSSPAQASPNSSLSFFGLDRFELIATAKAANNSCPTALTGVSGADCAVDSTGKVMTLSYSSCDFGSRSAVWNGSEVLTSSATVSCGTFPSTSSGATLRRSFGSGTTRRIGTSVHTTLVDTSTPSGYDSPVSGGELVSFTGSGSKTIQIDGIHLTATREGRGKNAGKTLTVWDHTLNTEASSPLTVAATAGARTVNGTVVVQHNLAKYKGTSVFKDVVYSPNSGCCFPQSGSVTTTFTGSVTGSETLTFTGGSCGEAVLKDKDGIGSSLTLVHCI